MRLFIAIPFEPAMRSALTDMQNQMHAQRITSNYTRPENLHLTLAFIGEYPSPEDVVDALPALTPFPIRLRGFGAFGELWWAGIEGGQPLAAYARRLRHALAESGIPFDRKRFNPHVTLIRGASGRPAIVVPDVSMVVNRVSVMRSDRGRNGVIYTEVGGIE